MTEVIVSFNRVSVTIPNTFIQKEFYKHGYLSHKKHFKINKKLAQIETAINQLNHAKSLLEKINLRFEPTLHPPFEYLPKGNYYKNIK